LWSHALAGLGSLGGCRRSRPVRRFGDGQGYRSSCFAGRSFFGTVGSAPHVLLLDVSFSLTGPFRGLGQGTRFAGAALRSRLTAAVSAPSAGPPFAGWSRSRATSRPSGRVGGQPSVRPSGRARGAERPLFGVVARPTRTWLFGVIDWCDAAAMAIRTRFSVVRGSSGPSGLEVPRTTPGQGRQVEVPRDPGVSHQVWNVSGLRGIRLRGSPWIGGADLSPSGGETRKPAPMGYWKLWPSFHGDHGGWCLAVGRRPSGSPVGAGHSHSTPRFGWVRRCGLVSRHRIRSPGWVGDEGCEEQPGRSCDHQVATVRLDRRAGHPLLEGVGRLVAAKGWLPAPREGSSCLER
jgi:hypothetical protein